MIDRPGLTDEEITDIQKKFYSGCYDDSEINRLFETILVQRQVLRELFALFIQESPLRRVSVAEPVRNSQLAYLKELVSMDGEKTSNEGV